jgi:saccharopine dehydrogenase-like NADP-dependent oxidoreductase
MTRVIVAGARGFFGSLVVRLLRAEGAAPITASRKSGADLTLDVEDRASIRAALRPRDVIVDATAPFQTRPATLVDEAIAIGADIVDLSDSLSYARLVWTRNDAARTRGVRVLNACSAVSALSAYAIECSGIRDPLAIHGFLAPATRRTANRGVTESLLASVGRSIEVRRAGELRRVRGWIETREFPALGRRGHVMEMADTFTLPRVFPSLRDVDFWVDPNTPGVSPLMRLLARAPALAPIAAALAGFVTPLARIAGSEEGVLAYEVEGSAGERATIVFTGRESFLMAALPAALAAIRLASGDACPAGVVPVNQHVRASALDNALTRYGIVVERRS